MRQSVCGERYATAGYADGCELSMQLTGVRASSFRAQEEVECRSHETREVYCGKNDSEWRHATHSDSVLRHSLAAKLRPSVGCPTF